MLALLLGAIGAVVGWQISDRLESKNAFCTSCHLDAQTPLHRKIARDFAGVPATTLAARHAATSIEGRQDASFRCVDCHAGTGFTGRLRVKWLAMSDSVRYALGRFEEPKNMRVPLRDEDCEKCHPDHPAQETTPGAVERFHALAVHDTNLGVACVSCHEAHEQGGTAEAVFLRRERVMPECARCHPAFGSDSATP